MKFRLVVVLGLLTLSALAQGGASTQTSQATDASQAPAQGTHKSAGGQQTVTGCVVREGEGFALKNDEGTYPFDTSRDLSSWVGKQVRITGTWKATGVTTTAPIKASVGSSTQQTTNEKKAGTAKAFVGDLHLHITGNVIGDCAQK